MVRNNNDPRFGGDPNAGKEDRGPRRVVLDDKGEEIDFRAREEKVYQHSYAYLGGQLGKEELDEEDLKRQKMGTLDMDPVMPPHDQKWKESIEGVAPRIAKTKNPDNTESVFFAKNVEGFFFLADVACKDDEKKKQAREYYKFILHACQREVDWKPIIENFLKAEVDRANKLKAAGLIPDTDMKNLPQYLADADREEEAKKKLEPGCRVECLNLKGRADLNGLVGEVLSFDEKAGRYHIRMDRYKEEVKIKEENVMKAAVQTKEDFWGENNKWKAEYPQLSKVEVVGLKSEAAKWINGQLGVIIDWVKDKERYAVRLNVNKQIKELKPINVKLCLPEGWDEVWDQQFEKYYYVQKSTQKISWRHPAIKKEIKKDKTDIFDKTTAVNYDLKHAQFGKKDK